MADYLFPTKTRLALLQAVADGAVEHCMHWLGTKPSESRWDRIDATPRWKVVTAAAKELGHAGWIRLGRPDGKGIYSTVRWELTDTGRAVLEANGGKP